MTVRCRWLLLLLPALLPAAKAAGLRLAYELPPNLMLHYKMEPIPWHSPQGQPRPEYDWKLYGVSQSSNEVTRFLFELTVLHVNQLIDPSAQDLPFYHVGYFDVGRDGTIAPNPTLTPLADPNMLFPILPAQAVEPGASWTTLVPTGQRRATLLSTNASAQTVFEQELQNRAVTNLTAVCRVVLDTNLGLTLTNTLSVVRDDLSSTNRLSLVEYLFYPEDQPPLIVRESGKYLAALEPYVNALGVAEAAAGLEEAARVLDEARVALNRAREEVREPRLARLLKQRELQHTDIARKILGLHAQRRMRGN